MERPVWKATPETDAFARHIFETRRGILDIAAIFDVDRDPQLWYYIPGFNGYEMSDYGLVRSMKFFQRQPFGLLIKFDERENMILSDNNNDRIRVNRRDLWKLVVENPRTIVGYPRTTNQTDSYSRNKRMFLESRSAPKRPGRKTKSHVPTNKKEDTLLPHFTVIPDDAIEVFDFFSIDDKRLW